MAVPRGQRGPAAERRRRQVDARAFARDMQILRPRPARRGPSPTRSARRASRPTSPFGPPAGRGAKGCLSYLRLLGLALVLGWLMLSRKSRH
jgi:hypothetical protein